MVSIVPSYAAGFLHTHNLALLAAVAAIALVSSLVAQIGVRRWRPPSAVGHCAGLAALAAGLVALVAALPLRSLPLLVAGAVVAGVGHGLAFLNAQEELNRIAPEERRGEVTAAFIACIYFLLASAVIATGLLDLDLSLTLSVGVVSLVPAAAALAIAALNAIRSATAAST